jgi:hypothetical protein
MRALRLPAGIEPLQTARGQALVGLWVCDFTDASLGLHHELQVSVFVTRQPAAPVAAQPLSLLAMLLSRSDVLMLCHGLWNNTPGVVAYNRELLGLHARLVESRIARAEGALSFAFQDQADGQPMLTGTLHDVRRPSLRANLALMGRLGPARLMAAAGTALPPELVPLAVWRPLLGSSHNRWVSVGGEVVGHAEKPLTRLTSCRSGPVRATEQRIQSSTAGRAVFQGLGSTMCPRSRHGYCEDA